MKKMTISLRRMLALLLVVSMTFGLTACGNVASQKEGLELLTQSDLLITQSEQSDSKQTETTTDQVKPDETKPAETKPAETIPVGSGSVESKPAESKPIASQTGGAAQTTPVKYDRESMEQIVEVLGGSNVEADKLGDEELDELVQDLVEKLDKEAPDGIVNTEGDKTQNPSVDIEISEEFYDENGAMNVPFDQAYPELVENGSVEYDDETLLIKMHNSQGGQISEGMQATGVAALEVIVPMEETSWYEAKLVAGTDAAAALELLRDQNEVIVAEYNYKITTSALDSYKDWKDGHGFDKNEHHKDQWQMHHCGIPDGVEQMQTKGGASSVIVAVIDSGVDYDHEDLAQNIWVNVNEVPNDGIDNDGNGYVDDYYGVNIVAGYGNGDDDNGHGTHVAGIIAAQNNNIGVMGLAYNVKIMPIKAASASGYLHQSDIAKAVLYAYENGAEVINMSFGGTACSIAVQDALAVAYTRCVLVASAGNEGAANEDIPNYPAGLNYVLGVMSVDKNGVESVFTNYDVTGFNGVEYELYAPGDSIMSTLPDNRYGILSGTSMAAPMVSAMAAILRSEFADRDKYSTKFIYGQLASTSDYQATCLDPEAHGVHNLPQIVNLQAALTKLPQPEVNMQDYAIFDTPGFVQDEANANTGEGVIDAGETVALGLTLRNRWGMSENTIVKIDALSQAGIADPYVTILNDTVNFDSVGTYSTKDSGRIYNGGIITGWEDPFYIRIAQDCPNDYIFRLNVSITCENALDTADTKNYISDAVIELKVRNGFVVPNLITEDTVWTADNLYIIPNATVIEEGVTVRVEPGTKIQFWTSDEEDPYADDYIAYLRVDGTFSVEGTKENPVLIYPSDLMSDYVVEFGAFGTGHVSLRYAEITNYYGEADGNRNYINSAYGCTFNNVVGELRYRTLYGGVVSEGYTNTSICKIDDAENCAFYKVGHLWGRAYIYGNYEGCIFVDSAIDTGTYSQTFKDCVFLGNYYYEPKDNYDGKSGNNSRFLVYQGMGPNMQPGEILVYYRPETGTTYLAVSGMTYLDETYFRKMGADYAKIEDEGELQWLLQNIPDRLEFKDEIGMSSHSGYGLMDMGVSYDYQQNCYVWADGTPVETVTTPDKPVNATLYYYKGVLSQYNEHVGHDNYCYSHEMVDLYEIPGEIYVTDIALSEYETYMDPETTYQIQVTTAPVNVPMEKLIFRSSDETIAAVSDTGLVTPVGIGTADIVVYSQDMAVSNYITVHVNPYVALENIQFPAENMVLAVGEQTNVACLMTPADTTRRNVTYTSSNPEVVSVDAYGNLDACGHGEAVITATSTETGANGQPISAQMTVTTFRKATSLDIEMSTVVAYLPEAVMQLPEVSVSEGAETDLYWESFDPAVAEVADGQLRLKNTGVTTLQVTDLRSGLQADCMLYVQENKAVAVKKLQSGGWNHYVLMEDGSLYFWGEAELMLLTTGVKDICENDDHVMICKENGIIEVWATTYSSAYIRQSFSFFEGKDVAALGYNRGQGYGYVCISDGKAYAWGDSNQYGQLGVGFAGSVESPIMLDIVDPVDVIMGYDITYILTATGELYYAGGSEERVMTPQLLENGVKQMLSVSSHEAVLLLENGQIVRKDIMGGSTYWNKIGSEVDAFTRSTSGMITEVVDGEVFFYYETFENSIASVQRKKIPGIINAVNVFSAENVSYIVTEDGLLFAYGSDSYNGHFAGMTNQTKTEVPILMSFDGGIESPVMLVETNLTDETMLFEKELVLIFNKKLSSASYRLIADDMQVTASYEMSNNKLVITRSNGFEPGVNYKLVIPANTIYAYEHYTNEEIVVEFVVSELMMEAPDADQGGVAEEGSVVSPIIRESVLDTAVERFYWTPDNVVERLKVLDKELNLNQKFAGNVILNRISTDTNVEHWMRFQGTESSSRMDIRLGGNYWGTTNETAISLQIIDYVDFPNYAKLVYDGYLTEAPENTFPFVTDVTVLNKEGESSWTVGNEEITVRVRFNRDMDMTIPLNVRFGSAYPYGDYVIPGNYEDARTWVGKYTLNTIIENGIQQFTISNGCSATGGLDLYADTGRFAFEIDTTAAQALIMQGTATDTGINLTWTQDDFDTLMGYNVYRSTSEDGYYQRLNSAVIPAEQMEFFDATVEPGVQYYYNFTVVKTDMSESVPSGKISIMSKDTMAPDIYHTPVYQTHTGKNLIISATVMDNLNIVYTDVYYKTVGAKDWKVVRMNSLNSKFSAIIPASDVTTAGIAYYLDAFDGVSHTYKGSAKSPYVITVQEAVADNALGDVNNDGMITNYDALLLLYAINDQYNLTAAEFARADLNGDGVLWAAEALRILQYVSGTVGSVKM